MSELPQYIRDTFFPTRPAEPIPPGEPPEAEPATDDGMREYASSLFRTAGRGRITDHT